MLYRLLVIFTGLCLALGLTAAAGFLFGKRVDARAGDPLAPSGFEKVGVSGGTATATTPGSAGNTAPVPVIIVPTASQVFRVGETISLQGEATDAEDGNIPDTRLTWEVLFHHAREYTDEYLPPTTGNNIPLTTPPPENLPAAASSFLEIRLTATDSAGSSSTVTRNLQPRRVNITLRTAPSELRLRVNGINIIAPSTFVSWDGYPLNVAAASQGFYGVVCIFHFWSDGGAASHTITTPATDATYTAVFAISANSADLRGRVLTEGGRGINNAIVKLSGPYGTRTALTNSLGQYTFHNTAMTGPYTITVTSGRYRFSRRTFFWDGDPSGIDFVSGM